VKLVQGHIAEVHDGQSRTGCSQCFLTRVLILGGELNIRSVKLGPPPVAANSEIPAPNLQNSKLNAVDAIEAAAANLNDAGNATINRPISTARAAPLSSPLALLNSPLAPPNSPPAPPAPSNTLPMMRLQLPLPLVQPPRPVTQYHHNQHRPCQCGKIMALDGLNLKTPDCRLGLPCQTSSGESTVQLRTTFFASVAIQDALCPDSTTSFSCSLQIKWKQ
jgi:hypothetical protein